MNKLLCAALFSCLTFIPAMAQDPTKVEPSHYKLEFENERVQVVYIHYGPHEKSGLHDHTQGVAVNLTDTHMRFTDQNGKVQEVFGKRGEARWFPPFKHRVENLSDTAFSGIYIGVKGKVLSTSDGKPKPPPEELTAKILAAYLAAVNSPGSPK